jgi:hypothetical protein
MVVLAIDPGPEESAYMYWNGVQIGQFGKIPNTLMLEFITGRTPQVERCVIEKVASFGMPVGAEVFETVYWSGVFAHAFGLDRVSRITRIEIKNHLCHSSRAKDGNIRQALIDRLGAPGTKKAPGPTYGVSADIWSALAVAVTWWDVYRAG